MSEIVKKSHEENATVERQPWKEIIRDYLDVNKMWCEETFLKFTQFDPQGQKEAPLDSWKDIFKPDQDGKYKQRMLVTGMHTFKKIIAA